jgi:hypothetical protein
MAKQPSFDPFDTAVLTNLVRRPLEAGVESNTTIGEQIAPLVPVNSREVSVQTRDPYAFGKGQFRAPDATPPLVEFQVAYTEKKIELVLIDEMHRIKEEEWMALQSADENIRNAAGLQLVERGQMLAIRNRRATEDLRWQAFNGEVRVPFQRDQDDESELVIDYGLPAGHTPTAGTLWSDYADSDPIGDITAWQELSANALGHYGSKLHMSNKVWLDLRQNENIAGYLTGQDRPLLLPTVEDIQGLLPYPLQIIVTDAGYREESVGLDRGVDSLTKFIPEDKVLLTTDYTIDGERIADVPDGLVTTSSSYNSVNISRGPKAEVILDHVSKIHFLRYASARIPRIHHPEAFVWATVR